MADKNLRLVFGTEAGKESSMTLSGVKQDLQADAVKTAMQTMVTSGAFATSKGDKYNAVVSATYVETVTTELFTNEPIV